MPRLLPPPLRTRELDTGRGARPLANYYRGFAAYQETFLVEDSAALPLLRESEKHLRASVEARSDFAEAHAMLARVYPTYYRLDPGRAAVAGPLGDEHLEIARRLAPDNPRVRAIEGLDLFYSPPQYGGDPARGVELLEEALDLLPVGKTPSRGPEPDWGEATIRTWLGRALLSRDAPRPRAGNQGARTGSRDPARFRRCPAPAGRRRPEVGSRLLGQGFDQSVQARPVAPRQDQSAIVCEDQAHVAVAQGLESANAVPLTIVDRCTRANLRRSSLVSSDDREVRARYAASARWRRT